MPNQSDGSSDYNHDGRIRAMRRETEAAELIEWFGYEELIYKRILELGRKGQVFSVVSSVFSIGFTSGYPLPSMAA